jgi:hypothetical protein
MFSFYHYCDIMHVFSYIYLLVEGINLGLCDIEL